MSKRPVVIYGASGFSGRLVAEFLREYNLPFIAAGRNKTKIEEVMTHVPGIETADYEVVETSSSVDELVKLFAGAKVVCNTVGPFHLQRPARHRSGATGGMPLRGYRRRAGMGARSGGEVGLPVCRARVAGRSGNRVHVGDE